MNRRERRALMRNRVKEIIRLEKECQQGKNVEENQKKLAELASQLTIEEMLALDDYIMSKNILTK